MTKTARTIGWRSLRLAQLCGVVLSAVLFSGTSTAAPFTCSSVGYVFQDPVVDAFELNLATVNITQVANDFFPGNGINAIGYNVLDDFIYGIQTGGGIQVVRVHNDFTTIDVLGVPAGYPAALAPNFPAFGAVPVGDVDDAGRYWFFDAANPYYYQVDLTTNTVVTAGPFDPVAAGLTNLSDWAYIPGTDQLFGLALNGGNWHLISLTRATGALTDHGSLGALGGATTAFGATFADAEGRLYALSNNTGQLFRINVNTVTPHNLGSTGETSSANDGARCANAAGPVVPPPPPPPPPPNPSSGVAVPAVSPFGLALLAVVLSLLGIRRR